MVMESMKAGGFGLAEPLTSEDPRKIAGYQLRARLGAGGMGRVYLAFTQGGRAVAIKVVRAEFGDEEEFRDRFRREVVAAQRVHGMYAAQVLDADPDAPQPWLATTYVPGLSLQQAVTDHGPLPSDSVFLLVAGIAEALQAIHAAGIVHRDLKPSNVILAADGPRVIDFGIARAVAATALTRSGVRIGSPRFMAPEQARGQPVTPAVDVFALGSLATYAIAGQPPFGGDGAVAVLHRVLNEAPDLGGCPADLRPLIERCLAKDPAQRPRPAEIIDTCQARMTDGALAFDGAWLPAAVSAVAAAPFAALVPGRGSGPGDATGTEPSFSGEYSGPGALGEDSASSVVRDPPERPAVVVAAAVGPAAGPAGSGRPDKGSGGPDKGAGGPDKGAGGPDKGAGGPGTPRRTIIRRSAAVFGLVAAVAAGVILLPGAASPGTGHPRLQAVGGYDPTSAPSPARSSPATARRRPPASPATPHPSPSGAGAASGASPPAPSATTSPPASPAPTGPPASPAPARPPASPAPTGRAAFGGTWSGTVSQPAWTVTSWTIELVIPATGRQGSYSAPSSGCSGTLTLHKYTGTTMRAKAKTTSTASSDCVSKARLTLDLSGSAEITMTWVPVGRAHKKTGTATLTRG
jgi:serine/threonine kinase PknH